MKYITVKQDGKQIHHGIVVGETTTHYKVFLEKGIRADTSPQSSEWFAKKSKTINCYRIS